jgi:hypothetical protein
VEELAAFQPEERALLEHLGRRRLGEFREARARGAAVHVAEVEVDVDVLVHGAVVRGRGLVAALRPEELHLETPRPRFPAISSMIRDASIIILVTTSTSA